MDFWQLFVQSILLCEEVFDMKNEAAKCNRFSSMNVYQLIITESGEFGYCSSKRDINNQSVDILFRLLEHLLKILHHIHKLWCLLSLWIVSNSINAKHLGSTYCNHFNAFIRIEGSLKAELLSIPNLSYYCCPLEYRVL